MSLAAAVLACSLGAEGPVSAVPPGEQLKQAKATFDYGNYAAAAEQLEQLTAARALERVADQIEAFRLLGLAELFIRHPAESHHAFLNLLSLDPDFQLDPLYVPPQAIAFFDKVRLDNQALLEPIRRRRRATLAAMADEEQARQRLLAPQAAVPTGAPQVVRERLEQPSALVALLPGGIGQFQNGDLPLGVALATAEFLTLSASIACWAWVEGQRNSDGHYSAGTYDTALTVRSAQIGSGVAFAALWAGGAIEAVLRLRPPRTIIEPEPPGSGKPGAVGFGLGPLPGGAQGALSLAF